MMRTSLTWIQQHPREEVLRHILNMVKSLLCPSTDYLENYLLPNGLTIVRNLGDDEE
jgi:hypothetical protein